MSHYQQEDEMPRGDYDRLETDRDRLKAENILLRNTWRCFHCDFETADRAQAAAHFGDDEGDPALCLHWSKLSTAERLGEYQDLVQQLSAEREETARQRSQIEGLEYRLLDVENIFDSRFPGCTTLNQVFNLYDSMEGRALAAEEQVQALTREHR